MSKATPPALALRSGLTADWKSRLATGLPLWLLAWLAGTALWQSAKLRPALQRGHRLAAASTAFTVKARRRRERPARVLVVGDSTGVGVGASDPSESVPGLLARDHPDIDIINLCHNGDQVADVLPRLHRNGWHHQRFDAVLLHVGGNDVLKRLSLSALRRDVISLLHTLRQMSDCVVWLGPANIGLASPFLPPLSWWLSRRTRRFCRLFARCAREQDVDFVNFFSEPRDDVFSRERSTYFAADRFHPSSASYRYCYDKVRQRTRLTTVLSRQRAQAARMARNAPANLSQRHTDQPRMRATQERPVQRQSAKQRDRIIEP
ncbi:MAG TPA: GDSL-type esterase/lipase family protein [Rubrivivax sp.]|nr:GDSL-type esterase/lipase family protein [Rubrivivax sp.]